MWKIIRKIKNFFEAIDDFLIMCEDYFDLRIKTGKAKGDIQEVTEKLKETTGEKLSSTSNSLYKSTTVQQSLYVANKKWTKLMQIVLLEKIASLVFEAFFLVHHFYTELFFSLALTLPTFLILLNFFEHAPLLFFLSFFPLILFNGFCISVIYYRIDKHINGEKLPLLTCIRETFHHFSSISSIIFMHIFVILQLILFFVIFTLFLGYFFDLIHINWTNSFIYWFITVCLIFFTVISIFIFGITADQAYYYAVLQQKHPFQAFKASWALLDKNSFTFFFFYIILYFCYFPFIYWSTLTFYHTGFIITVFLLNHGIIFLSFLLRRKFINRSISQDETFQPKQPTIFTVILILGFFAYTLVAALVIKEYPRIISYIELTQEGLLVNKQLTKSYIDKQYGYSIKYPQTWDLYGWNENSVTFYNNNLGTNAGGIWLNIIVSPFSKDTFEKLSQSKTGLIDYNTQTKDQATKISDVTIDGYIAVNYLFTKNTQPYPQYQTHYLIHKDTKMYDIVFITMQKEVEQRNKDVFEGIISSFKFTRE